MAKPTRQYALPMVEFTVVTPLLNPETLNPAVKHKFAGKVDIVTEKRIIDWKTVADVDLFEHQKIVGYQPELYADGIIAATDGAVAPEEYEFRLIARPTISFCSKDASLDDYVTRCVMWFAEKPMERIRRVVFFFSEARRKRAREWLWGVHERILANRKTGNWLTNEMACDKYNRLCPYAPLCRARANGNDWESVAAESYTSGNSHPELGLDGPEYLTYSSATTFALCEAKYGWRYELGLRPKTEDDADARNVGTASHLGLETYLKTGSVAAAEAEVMGWLDAQPLVGPEATKKAEQQAGKARAIVQVAAMRWPVSAPANP